MPTAPRDLPQRRQVAEPNGDEPTRLNHHHNSARQTVSPFFTAAEAAEFLRLSVVTLARMRMSGDGPRYRAFSRRKIVYALADLIDWANAHVRQSTSETR